MSSDAKNLGQQLTELETVNPAARDRYERQLQNILEERLSAPVRGCSLAAGMACLLFGAATCYAVFGDRQAYAYWPNLLLGGVVTLTALVIGIAVVGVAIRGVYRHQHEGRWAAWSAVAMLLTWGLYLLLAASGLPDSMRGVFLSLGLGCWGAAAFTANRVSAARAQLALEKRLLYLEYRLAEISERLDRG